jgi:hypothetical protein
MSDTLTSVLERLAVLESIPERLAVVERAVVVNRRRYWDGDDLDQWDRSRVRETIQIKTPEGEVV